MNSDALNAVLNNLYQRNRLVRAPAHDTLYHCRFVFAGRLSDEEIDVVPALTVKALNEIVLGAINGNLPDMATVSMMYNAGFCLPQCYMRAEAWAAFAGMNAADNVSYEDAIKQLKIDRRDNAARERDGLIWPEEFEQTIDEVLRKCNRPKPYTNQKLEKGVCITPRLSGVRVNLVYRAYEVDGEMQAHLYAAFLHIGEKIVYTLDQLRHLDIPLEFGQQKGYRKVIRNYTPFGRSAELYVVQGTLVSPKSLRADMRQHFPDAKTVSDLLREYLGSVERRRIDDFSFVVTDLKEELAETERKLAAYASRSAKPKFAEKIGKLEKRKAKLETRIANSQAEREQAQAEYVKTLPEHYLKFVATGMFVYQNGKLMGPQMRIKPAVHLQSLGFRSLSHPLVELLGYEVDKSGAITESALDNIIAKFEQAYDDQYTVTGLSIRPYAESVNIKRCYSYTKSKGDKS